MAIDLQNSTNIGTGWGKPPDFSAPNISGVLGDILRQRQFQQELQQKQIADAVKQIQEQRSASAYGQALQSTGVVPQGVDVSRLDSDALSKLATLYQGTIPDTDADNVHKAMAAYYNAKAAEPYAPSRGSGYDVGDAPETQTDSAGRVWQKTRTGWKPLAVGLQPTDVRTQNENQILKEQAGLLEQKGGMDAEIASQRAQNIKDKLANVPYTRSDEYNRTVNRLKQIQQMKTAPSTQPDAAPQPSPAETGDPLPTTQPQPQGTPRPSAYASPDQIRMARARQAMDDPQATAAEKEQARKILAGE